MASVGVILLLLVQQTVTALDLHTGSSPRILKGSNAVLPCTFSTSPQPLNLDFLAVLWRFQGKVILRYENKEPLPVDPRISLKVQALQAGDASLYISNVALSDGGIYTCVVVYTPEKLEMEILLQVQAQPLISILNKEVQKNREETLTCRVAEFFPPDVRVTWLRDGEVLKDQFMGRPQKSEDGSYRVNSTVTITPTDQDRDRNFSCRVQHATLQEDLQEDFQLDIKEGSSSGTIIVSILLAVLLSTVAIGIFCWKQRHKRGAKGTFTVMNIEGPSKLVAGEEAILHCTATNCPENMRVTWLENRAGKLTEIQVPNNKDMEQEERLLATQYIISSQLEGPKYLSSLKFTPNMATHKGVTLVCTYSCGKEKKQKTFQCRLIYAKPKQTQPVSRRLLISGELMYSVNLENFFPRDITIRWTCGVEESQETISSTTVTENPDGTYSAHSKVTIAEELLKNPQFTVQVSWEHVTLNTPGHKELSIRDSDYPWNPVVEEIQVPRLPHDTPVTLQCHISEYFPGDIAVTWLRRNAENEELVEEAEALVSRTVTQKREDDHTYSCTASLTITPKLHLHQGAAYICRVEHPSLDNPIEKSTAQLVVNAVPQMVEPIQITMGESSRIHFTLRLQRFHPKDIEIQWRYVAQCANVTVPSKETLAGNEDLTYDVISVGHASVHQFKDPQFQVYITWKHQSMDEPETRSLSSRDLPWKPQVGDIIIPKLKQNSAASLQCNITDYFPDCLAVRWFMVGSPGTDSESFLTPLPNDTYKVSKKNKVKNNLCSLESSLSFTPLVTRDQGAEFICRVEHPSLERPIERSTGPIDIATSTLRMSIRLSKP